MIISTPLARRPRFRTALWSAGLVASVAACTAVAIEFPIGRLAQPSLLPAVLRYDDRNGLPVVQAAVGISKPLTAAVETALPMCVVSKAVAEREGFDVGLEREVPAGPWRLRAGPSKGRMVRLGRAMVDETPFMVGDLASQLASRPAPDMPELWLGGSFLRCFTVTLDPSKNTIELAVPAAPLPRRAAVTPIDVVNGAPVVDVRIGSKHTFRAVLSSGSPGSLIPAGVARSLGLAPARVVPVILGSTKGVAAAVELKEIRLGSVRVEGVQAVYIAEGPPPGTPDELGIIGMNVLGRFRTTIQYLTRRLGLEPVAAPSDEPVVSRPSGSHGSVGGARSKRDH